MSDPFISVKAQLDNHAKWQAEAEVRLMGEFARLMAACKEIAAIKPDDHGNGLRLAIQIAQKAIDQSEL